MTESDTTPAHIVLTDGAGNHYLLTPALLEQARISDTELAELTGAEADDTGGYFFSNLLPQPAGNGGGVAIGSLGPSQSLGNPQWNHSKYYVVGETVDSPTHATRSNP
jgi:hypothetical protein